VITKDSAPWCPLVVNLGLQARPCGNSITQQLIMTELYSPPLELRRMSKNTFLDNLIDG